MPIAERHFPNLIGEKGDLDNVEVDNTIRNSWLAVYSLQEEVTIMQDRVAGAIRRGEISLDDTAASTGLVRESTIRTVVQSPATGSNVTMVSPISGRLPYINPALELAGGLAAPEYNPTTKSLTIRGAGNFTGTITGLSALVISGVSNLAGAVTMQSTLDVTGAVTLQATLSVTGQADFQSNVIIDVDNAEALLVRTDGDGADVFTVNTATPGVLVGGTLAALATDITGLLTVNGNVTLPAADLGNDVPGRCVIAGRNTNGGAEGPAPASWELEAADGVSAFLWIDDDGDLRIHTAKATGSTGTPTVDANTAGVKLSQTVTKQFSFLSPGGGSGIFFAAGYYDAPLTDANLTQASTTVTHGSVNHPYFAHAFIVAAAAGTASGGAGTVEIEVSGTSLDDNGVRTAADTEVLTTDITALSTDEYIETTKKWIGQVTYTLQVSGGGTHTTFAVDFNYGFAKYEDAQNTDFLITSFELVGRAGGNDTGFNVELCEHTPVGWTYSAAAFLAGVAPAVVDVAALWSTESDLINGEHFAFRKFDLSTQVQGSEAEGFLVRVTTTTNNAVETMNITVGGRLN